MGQEREKKILVPNFVLTRFGKENSEKYSKKIPKIKKPFSNIIFSQNGMRLAEKEKKKNLLPNSILTQPDLENSKKK